MKKTMILGLMLVSCGAFASEGMSGHAGNAASAASVAVVASGVAVGESAMATGKLASGVAAVPLKAVGAVGAVAGKAGDVLMSAATGEPLPIAKESVTVGAPPKAE